MAPQTNIGSATPISLGGGDQDEVLGRKIRNDAAAYVRALAEGHGRNGDLAEQMVRKATNVTATEAQRRNLDRPRRRRRAGAGARARRLPREGAEGADARDDRRAHRVARRAVQVRRRSSCW